MRQAWCFLVICGLTTSVALAGPNAGGTIIAHDASIAFTGCDGPCCGQGVVLTSCGAADVELDGSNSTNQGLWKIYACFPRAASPRLAAISLGIHYPSGSSGISIVAFGPCGVTSGYEFPEPGWPGNDSGDAMAFTPVMTATVNEIYWFFGYTKSAGAHNIFQLRDNPDPNLGGAFADDASPANVDPIAGYGSMGFDTPGTVACPDALGACCDDNTGACTLVPLSDCAPPERWQGSGSCNPNPCPATSSVGSHGPGQAAQNLSAAPNPSRGDVFISYRLAAPAKVSAEIFDASGRLCRTLRQGTQAAGGQQFRWDGRDDAGRAMPSGVYLVRLVTETGAASELRLELIR